MLPNLLAVIYLTHRASGLCYMYVGTKFCWWNFLRCFIIPIARAAVQVIEPLVEQLRPFLQRSQQPQHHADHHHHPCDQHSHPQQLQSQQQQQVHQQQPDFLSEKLTMLLLLQEPSAWGLAAAWPDPQQHKQWQQLLDASAVSIVEGEVQYLRQQLLHIDDVLQECRDGEQASGSGPVCRTCPFQLDCTVKGCIRGDLQPVNAAVAQPSIRISQPSSPQHAGTAAARPPAAGGCCGGQHASGVEQSAGHGCCN